MSHILAVDERGPDIPSESASASASPSDSIPSSEALSTSASASFSVSNFTEPLPSAPFLFHLQSVPLSVIQELEDRRFNSNNHSIDDQGQVAPNDYHQRLHLNATMYWI